MILFALSTDALLKSMKWCHIPYPQYNSNEFEMISFTSMRCETHFNNQHQIWCYLIYTYQLIHQTSFYLSIEVVKYYNIGIFLSMYWACWRNGTLDTQANVPHMRIIWLASYDYHMFWFIYDYHMIIIW